MKQPRFLLENGAEVFRCGSFGLWGCSPHAPGNIGCCIPHGALLSRKVSRVCKGCSWIWGLTSPPCPRVNAGRLIPKDAPSGIKPAHLRKESCPLQGLTPPPLPRVNAGRLIPSCASRRINKQRKGNVLLCLFIKMCVSPVRSAQREWSCHCRGVGAASAPTFKNLYAVF